MADDRSWASTLTDLRRRIAEDGARLRVAQGDDLPELEPSGVSAQLGPHLLALLEYEVANAHGPARSSRRRGLAIRMIAALLGTSRAEAADLVAAGRTAAGLRVFNEAAVTEITAALERLEVQVARVERQLGELREAERTHTAGREL